MEGLQKNSFPTVSVIIPNYNHAQFLKERIESVLQQTFADFELIILDDASTDNSREIIDRYTKEDKRISFYPSDTNSGSPFIQWNRGVELAKANLVWIAESDDVAAPDFLNTMIHQHEAKKGISLAFCQSNRVNVTGQITGTWKTFTDHLDLNLFGHDFTMGGVEFISKFLIKKNVIPNASAVLFKKSVYSEVNGADEKLKTNSDWLTWLKMLLKYDVAFIAKPLNSFRFHSESVIAKMGVTESKKYKEQYDVTMRNALEAYCKISSFVLPADIRFQNKQYRSYDYGNKGIYEFKKGRYVKGFTNLLAASLSPTLTLSYFRKLLKIKSLL